LLAFVPPLAYFVVAPVSVSLALWLALASAFAVGIQAFIEKGEVRLFDAAGFVLFGALALYGALFRTATTGNDINLVLETGYLAVAVRSMSIRQPFTAQYGLLPDVRDKSLDGRANTILTAAWATTFALMAAADAATTVLHKLSAVWSTGLGLAVFAGALTFTWQFSIYIGRRAGSIPAFGKTGGLHACREGSGTDLPGPVGDIRVRGAFLDHRQHLRRDGVRHGARNQPDVVDPPARPRSRPAPVADPGPDHRVRRRDDPLS
jgi:hypothetical protein